MGFLGAAGLSTGSVPCRQVVVVPADPAQYSGNRRRESPQSRIFPDLPRYKKRNQKLSFQLYASNPQRNATRT